MAIVKMSKLNLVGIAAEENAVMDALQRTGAVEVTVFKTVQNPEDEDATEAREVPALDPEKARKIAQATQILTRDRSALDALVELVTRVDKKKKQGKSETIKPYCDVTFSDFFAIEKREKELSEIIEKINDAVAQKQAHEARCARIESETEHLKPYESLQAPFSAVGISNSSLITVGSVPSESLKTLREKVAENPLFCMRELSVGTQNCTLLFAAHKSAEEDVNDVLAQVGFAKCTYTFDATAAARIEELSAEKERLTKETEALDAVIYAFKPQADALKILADFHAYDLEKLTLANDFSYTDKTFCLSAYVPAEEQDAVVDKVKTVTEAVYFEFTEPSKTDEVPTLVRNNKVVQPMEFITNLYSVPSYRERDPNWVMGIFFMVFFGFIMADIGYGILVAVIGLLVGLKMRKSSGSRSLVLLIGMGGIFTVIWGALFGSLFGYTLYTGVMPNPEKEPATLLVYCLAVGVLQIMVGFIQKGVQSQEVGSFWDGLFDGYIWSVFCVGILLIMPEIGISLFNANIGFTPPSALMYAGFGVAGGALLLAVVTAGRKEKKFGKFTKGFGAVYGVINFLSDVLSYARLFGLMLSGAIVARIVTEMSIGMMTSVGGIIGGVLILLVGHAFNLAMNLLGAYIHDSRLQYIEYYSRFYQGEGTLFSPLGSRFNYITLKNNGGY